MSCLPKVYIYTANFGNYDHELPNVCVRDLEDYELICFSECIDSVKPNHGWKHVNVQKYFKDNKLNNGYVKCMAHHFFGENCICIWIDANLYNVNINRQDVINSIMISPVSTVCHYVRNTIREEAAVVINNFLDIPQKVLTHIAKISKYKGDEITGLSATMFLIRDLRNPKVRKMNFTWFEMIYNGSRRDQLSFNYACWLYGIVPSCLGIDWRIDNKFFCRRKHSGEVGRVIDVNTNDGKIDDYLCFTLSQLERPSLPKNYPQLVYFHEDWDVKTLNHIENLNIIVRESNEKLEGNYCYMHECTPSWKEIPDLRRSWKREFLRRALIGADNVVEIGFNAGHSAALILGEGSHIKLACVDIGKHSYSKSCADYLLQQFEGRFSIVWMNSFDLMDNINFFERNFDFWHIDGGHGRASFENDVNLFLIHASKGSRVLVDDAYVDHIQAVLSSLELSGKISECCQHILSSGENRLYIKNE